MSGGCGGVCIIRGGAVKRIDRQETLSPPEPAAHGEARIDSLFLLLLARRSNGPAGAHATVDVLLFLFGWFQDLCRERKMW